MLRGVFYNQYANQKMLLQVLRRGLNCHGIISRRIIVLEAIFIFYSVIKVMENHSNCLP